MPILKKLGYWLAAGIMLGVGFTVGLHYATRLLYPPQSDQDFAAAYKTEREKEMGITCAEVESNAQEFVRKSVKPIVNAGRSGGDWVAMSSPELLEQLKILDDQTMKCFLIESNADRVGLDMEGDFKSLNRLFSSLKVFMTPYGDDQPSSSKLKPEAFAVVEDLYVEVTKDMSEKKK